MKLSLSVSFAILSCFWPVCLESIKLSFSLKSGEDDKLFGSVTTQMISSELDSKGFSVDKKYICGDADLDLLIN